MDMVHDTGPRRAGPGPALVLPVCSGNKLEDVEGLPGGRRRATHPALTVPGVARPGSTRAPLHGRAGARVVRSRTAGDAPRTSARRAGNRPAGRPASGRRRSRTPSARSATAGTRRAAAPRGPDHQVGIGLTRSVQMVGDVLHIEDLGELLDAGALGGVVVEQGADGVGDLTPASVPDGDVHQQARVGGGGLGGVLEHPRRLRREQVERPDRLDVPALGDQPLHSALDDLQQGLDLGGRAGEVVGGQQPQGDHLDAGLAAPGEQLEDMIRALLMARAHVGQAHRPGPPPVAVQDHPDVPRDRVPGQRRFQPPLIQPVDKIVKSHRHPFSAVA